MSMTPAAPPHTGSSMSWAIRGNAWTRLNVSDSQLTPFLNGERADAYQPMRPCPPLLCEGSSKVSGWIGMFRTVLTGQ